MGHPCTLGGFVCHEVSHLLLVVVAVMVVVVVDEVLVVWGGGDSGLNRF